MPRRGENIYKRKDGRWEGRYIKDHRNGKIVYGYVYARTYREVKVKQSEALEGLSLLQKQGNSGRKHFTNDSFEEVAEEWFVSLKPQIKESTIAKYTNILNGYLLPEFGRRSVGEISRDEIMAFCNGLLTSGGISQRALSPKTVAGIMSVLKLVLRHASQVRECPVADIQNIFIKQPQRYMRILSCAEQQRLTRYLYGDLSLCNLGILLCLYSGLRIGEICALKWGDISFDEQYLYVRHTMQRIQRENDAGRRTVVVVSDPKSDCSVRKVPIPDEIFRLVAGARQPADTYFLTGMVHRFVEPRTMQNRFRAVMEKCHISDANFHALRHTFATRCVELGFDVKSLSEILGHASVNITLNRYVHPSMELKQRNMNMLSNLFAVG